MPTPRIYRLALLKLLKQLDDLKSPAYIKEVTSPCGSCILFVPKSHGKLCIILEYRPTIKITVLDKCPLPRIDEMLDIVGDASYFYKLHLHSCFHQIGVYSEYVERY